MCLLFVQEQIIIPKVFRLHSNCSTCFTVKNPEVNRKLWKIRRNNIVMYYLCLNYMSNILAKRFAFSTGLNGQNIPYGLILLFRFKTFLQ